MNNYSLNFEVGVDVGEGGVDGSEGNGVVDKEGEAATPPAPRPIAANKSVIGNRRIFRTFLQFSFLYTRNDRVFLVEEMAQTRRRLTEAVTVPLNNRTWRARVRMDGGAEEEDEDEKTAHCLS